MTGLFAIAFATSLARLGEQPCGFFYEQKVMRKHLIESLEKQNIIYYCISSTKDKTPWIKSEALTKIPIHCVCRLPKLEGIKMIEDLCVSVSLDSQQPHTKWSCVR